MNKKGILIVLLIMLILSGCDLDNESIPNHSNGQNETYSETSNISETTVISETHDTIAAPNTSLTSEDNSTNKTKDIEPTYNNVTTVDEINSSSFNQEVLFSLFKEQKSTILKKIGDKYKVVGAGIEGTEEGYYYEDLGITIIFEKDSVYSIHCGLNVSINGATAGMNFEQIQEKLGKNEVEEAWVETPDNKAYMMTYIINDCHVNFLSYERDGSYSSLIIYSP